MSLALGVLGAATIAESGLLVPAAEGEGVEVPAMGRSPNRAGVPFNVG